ncbi:hypothetical protein [Actinomyces lilanjuaniae]|uniref:hypothetical protein n=1 Tax=Actinomyces lilanjuaniae TaxID=2321394 RepID=UPI001968AE22|nr:hypothetical protein [Actinomyces lilanjuaniae]
MSTPSTPRPGGGTTLTRRQRRERERAQEAERARQSGQAPGTGSLPDRADSAPNRPASVTAPAAPVSPPRASTDRWAAQTTSFDQVVTGSVPAAPRSAPPERSASPSQGGSPAQGARRSLDARRRAGTPRRGGTSVALSTPAPAAATPPGADSAPLAPAAAVHPAEPGVRDRGAEPGSAADLEDSENSENAVAAEPAPATGPQRVLGAALGRRPRGLAALALGGLVVAAMVLIPLAVTHLGLGGQGASSSAGAVETVLPGDAELSTVAEIAGRQGTVPVVSVKGVLAAPSSLVTDVLVEGTGRAVAEDEPVMLSVSTFSGIDGSNTTGTDSGTYLYTGRLTEEVGQDMDAALRGRTEGSRVVLRAPAQEEDGTRTTEITVVDILPTTATGEEQTAADNMPAVTVEDNGTVSVSVDDLPAPTSAAASTLVRGGGRQVGPTDRVVARYSIVSWSTGKDVTESTYGDAVLPRVIDMTDTMAGISQLLADVTVGSRVVMALPPELARGEDAVVAVIDVLAIKDSAASGQEAPGGAGASAVPTPSPAATPAAAPTAASGAAPAATAGSPSSASARQG